MKKRHTQSGASLPLVIALAVLVVIIGLGLFYFVMVQGGQKEFANAADAGALNVAKTVLTKPSIKLSDVSPEAVAYFKGVGDGANKDEINLRNINSVWGAALLVGLNYEAMANSKNPTLKGAAAEEAKQNALKMSQVAGDVSKALRTKLSDSPELKTAFVDFCTANEARELSKDATHSKNTKVTGTWEIAYCDKGSSSNVFLKDSQRPEGLSDETWNKLGLGANGAIPGYKDIELSNGLKYTFVPLSGKPHLVSQRAFKSSDKNSVGSSNADVLVPNTFMVQAQLEAKKEGENTVGMVELTSYGESGDLDSRSASIPGVVRVSNYRAMQQGGGEFRVASAQTVARPLLPARGLHAIEYLNFEMLYARSNSDGPPGSRGDAIVALMDSPVLLIKDPANPSRPPLKTLDNASFVWGTQLAIEDTYYSKIANDEVPDPEPTTDLGGGNRWECLNAPLPNSFVSKDVKDTTDLKKYFNPSNCKPVDHTMIGIPRPNTDLIADEWYTQQINIYGPHDDQKTVYGSTAHPHIWSAGPLVMDGNNKLGVKLCQSDSQLGFKNGWNDPFQATQKPLVYEYLNDKTHPAQLFSGMMVQRGPRRGNLTVGNPAAFATEGTVVDFLFPNGAPDANGNGTGVGPWGAKTMGGALAAQYEQEHKLYADAILGRVMTRLHQMGKGLESYTAKDLYNDLTSNVANNNPGLPMGRNVYLMAGTRPNDPTKPAVICKLDNAPEVRDYAALKADGKAIGEALDKDTPRSENPFDKDTNSVAYLGPRYPNREGLYNIPGDWGYTTPFVNQQTNEQNATDVRWWAMYVLTPSTGFKGILGDLSLREFFNQPDASAGWNGKGSQANIPDPCAATLKAGIYHGSRPIDCPCECFPEGAGAFLPDTSKVRLAQERATKRHKGINAQPHNAAPPSNNNNNNNNNGGKCHPNCSHGGPC